MARLTEQLKVALADRYRIEREIGSGGMATVYLAEDLEHHHAVALKVLRPELAAQLGVERFLREIEITRQLTHPFILPILASGTAEGFLYYVTPYVEGGSLRGRLEREKQLPVADAVQIGREVADALDYAHRHDVVHRDIKPENILLEENHAVVADFGLARAIQCAGGPKLTSTGVTLGTPLYMSPEQGAGSHELDGRSDVYSLGCVFYEMLAGQTPFSGPTPQAIQARHAFDAAPPLHTVRPGLPAELESIAMQALAKAPADRFATSGQFGQALARLESSGRLALASATQADTQPMRRGKGRRPIAWAVLGAAVIAVGVWAWMSRSPERPVPPTQRAWVLVAEFEGPAEDSSLAGATRDLVSAALDQSKIVATVPAEQIRLGLELMERPASTRLDPVVAHELAYRFSVRTVIEGRIGRLGSGYSLTLRAMDVDSSRTLATVSGTAKSDDDLIPAVERVSRELRRELGENPNAIRATRPLVQEKTPSLEAFRLMRRARRLMAKRVDFRGAMAAARQALSIDPEYADAWLVISECLSSQNLHDSAYAALKMALVDCNVDSGTRL